MATSMPPEDHDRPIPGDAPKAVVKADESRLPVAAGETASSAIAARARAEVEARFVYASRFPRVFQTARRRILDACSRPLFAAKARYSKPVGGKAITGLSIRFADEAATCWGNLDVTAMVVFDDSEKRIYKVAGIDLETNRTDASEIIIEKFVERLHPAKGSEVISQRLNTRGEVTYRIRATEDDLLVKVNNQLAKARRNVILNIIPADIKEEAEALIIKTQQSKDAEDPKGAIKKIVDAFWPMGVTPDMIVELLGHAIEQVNPAELMQLRAYWQSMDDAEATWAEIVEAHTGGKRPAAAETKGGEGLKSRISEKKAAGGAAPAAAATATEGGKKCAVCFRTDGTHDPKAPCYEEAMRAEDAEIARQDAENEKKRGGGAK